MSEKKINDVLNMNYWPERLETMQPYTITHDDNDGNSNEAVTIVLGPDGDAHISVRLENVFNCPRYRTTNGGGKFPKVRNALLVLAEAIRQEGVV